MEDKYKNSSGESISLQAFNDNLSDFLKVANVINSNLESVSNIPNAAKTLSQIIRGIDRFPKETIDVKNQSNALTSVSAAIKKLTADDKFGLNSINESIMNSLFHPDKFKNTIFQEVEELDPSMLSMIGKDGITEKDIDKIKTNHFINNLLLTSKYITSIFSSVGSFASLCTKEKIESFNNISVGISTVYTAFNAALLEIAKTSKDLLDFKNLPAAQEILAIVEKFKQDSLIYDADEMILFELEEKLKTDDGLTDKEIEKYNKLKNRKKPQNFFETISALNTGIFGIFKSISEFGKLEPVNPAKVLLNVQLSVWNLNIVIRQIPKIIQQIDANGLRKIALDMSPKATDHIIKSVFNTGSSTTTNEGGISETVSNSNNKESIIKESIQAMSPFDLIKCIFEMIDGLNNLKVINPVKAWLAIQSLQITIKWVGGGIKIVLTSLIDLGRRLTNVIKTAKETSDNIKSIFDSLKSISDNIIYVGKWAIPTISIMPLVLLFTKSLGGFIKTILKHLSMDDVKNNKAEVDISDVAKTANIETKNGKNKVTFLGSVITLLKEVMITSVIVIGLSVLVSPALAAMVVTSLFLFTIKAFVWMAIKMADEMQKTVDKIVAKNNKNKLNTSNNKDDSNKVIIFAGVYTILKDLNKIALQVILMSVLTIPALIAMGITLLFVGGLILFIYAVSAIESLLSNKIVVNIKHSLRQMWNIIKLISGIAAMTILLAVVAVVSIPALIIDLVFITLLTGFMFVINILLKIINIKVTDILTMILLLTFIGMLIVVALAVSKLSEIGSKIDWIGVLNIMGAILMFSVLAIGIGFVASLILPIIGVAALGLLGITILIGLLTLTAWMLYELQNFELDGEKIKSVVTSIIDSIKLIISNIFGPDETEGEKSDKGWFGNLIDVVGGPFRKLKTVAESLLTVPFLLSAMISIGCLFLLANMLEKISEIKLAENLETKIKQIIGAAKSVITAINTPEETTSQEDKKDKSWLSSVGEFLGNKFKNIGQVLSNINSAGVLISLLPNICLLRTIIDVLNDIDKYNVSGNISDKVTQIVRTAQIVSTAVNNDSKVDTIDPKKVRQFGNFVDDSIKYFKHINTLDVSKVKSLGDMYDKMGQFMDKLQDAPIADIADALVNKISPALSDINKSMSKNKGNATVSSQASQPSAQNATSTSDTINNLTNNTSTNITNNHTNNTSTNITNNQQPQNNVKVIDYSTMLENIEDLLEQIKQKLNTNQQLAF